MATFDEDTDTEEEVIECEETYGRFNSEHALRRANRRTTDDGDETTHLKVVNGDDRSAFLKNNPLDLLIW